MKKLSYQKEVNARKLTKELQLIGVIVFSVEIEKEVIDDKLGDFIATHIYVDDSTEKNIVDSVVENHDTTPEIDTLKNDTRQWLLNNTQIRQLVNASPNQIKNAVDGMTTAQLKEVLAFLLILVKILIKKEL